MSVERSNPVLRLFGHTSLFLGLVAGGFGLLILTEDWSNLNTWIALVVCLHLVVLGALTVLWN